MSVRGFRFRLRAPRTGGLIPTHYTSRSGAKAGCSTRATEKGAGLLPRLLFVSTDEGRLQPFAIPRVRIGLSTNKASATTTKFISAVTTNTMCQLPVAPLIRLATGTRKAEVPLAV